MRPCEFKIGLAGDWQPGTWHRWTEEDSGDGVNPYAIIELPDGTIKLIYAEHVRFPRIPGPGA